MRILHSSDWHLGQDLHGFDRGPEHDHFLDWLAGQIVALAVDALVVSGDIYDTANPPVAAQQRLFGFLARVLAQTPHLQVVLTGGNHDSASRVELPRALLDPSRVHLVGAMPRGPTGLDHARCCIPLRDAAGMPRAMCLAIPYLRPADLGEGGMAMLHVEATACADGLRDGLPLIVTGHLHASGGEVSELSERRIVLGGAEAVPVSMFPAHAAYVALGHLHKPQKLGVTPLVRYAGSPFPLAVSERSYRHSVVVLDVDGDQVEHALVEIPRCVAFLRVPSQGSAEPDEMLRQLAALEVPDGAHGDAYLEVVVSLAAPMPDLRQRVEAALAGRRLRLVRLERVTEAGGDLTAAARVGAGLGDLQPADVFAALHRQKYDAPPPDEMAAAFAELLATIDAEPAA
jgi:exonuclease SbcD